jgi:hypothetical protein
VEVQFTQLSYVIMHVLLFRLGIAISSDRRNLIQHKEAINDLTCAIGGPSISIEDSSNCPFA